MTTKRSLGLQGKLTILMIVMVLMPFGASAILIDQINKVATQFGKTEAEERGAMVEQVIRVYRDLVAVTKALEAEVAQRIAARPDVQTPAPDVLAKILEQEANLRAIAVLQPDGSVLDEASRPAEPDSAGLRDTVVDHALANGGSLRLTFRVIDTEKQLDALKLKLDAVKQFAQERSAFGGGQYIAFIMVMLLATALAGAFGWWASSRVTRRIEALVSTARHVSAGQRDARVELPGGGHDEMLELGDAFNTMLDDLEHARGQLEYLQRIGAWQDVARRLAHEIKNPLTPIQLAVQQTVSQYKGDDERYKKQLTECREIVEEEIGSLRRLVDTFRTLGQLPKVEKAPISLEEVAEELRLDPTYAAKLDLLPPPQPVTVRADKLLLKRVLANLVENGIHAGQEAGTEGKVSLAWWPRADVVEIVVDDHGKGVAAADRDKIFEPYVTTKSTGTGLGLAISRKIAIEHGGELSLSETKAPTGGARFVVTLPLRGPDQSMA
ncbi:MAG TPA: ATP-binding protein [Kofleriaceae bacterium]|jgi:nitrogen fixation/metabolism regulation signal transduction histidine kinase|nr:ATP-binding protein [Kofleriaceae bacterium]